jgi:AcrR family transcriptional regulator
MNTTSLPNRHVRRRMQTRQALIQSTLQLVLEKGFEAISIQDITERADLGRGTFYIHFHDKEEVVWSAFQEIADQLKNEAHAKLDRQMPQVEYYGLLNIFTLAAKHPVLCQVIFGRHGSAALNARAQDFLANIFAEDIRKSPPPSREDFHLPEEVETQILVGIIIRLATWWLETPNNYSADNMAAMAYISLYRKKAPTGYSNPR